MKTLKVFYNNEYINSVPLKPDESLSVGIYFPKLIGINIVTKDDETIAMPIYNASVIVTKHNNGIHLYTCAGFYYGGKPLFGLIFSWVPPFIQYVDMRGEEMTYMTRGEK